MVSITNARALEDERRAQRAAADDDLPASPVDLGLLLLLGVQRLGGYRLDAYRRVAIQDDLVDLGIADEMQVLVDGPGAVDVSVRRVGPATRVAAMYISIESVNMSYHLTG